MISYIALSDLHVAATTSTIIPTSPELFFDAAPIGDSTDTVGDNVWDTLGPADVVQFTSEYEVTQDDVDKLQ